jgi:uncharacterized membrane protein (UPF0127 family)
MNRRVALVIAAVLVGVAAIIGVLVYVSRDDDSTSTAAGTANRTPLAGFGETHVTVKTPTGTLEWCLLLAETQAQHNRGLMQVTDPTLGGYDGMLFRFAQDTEAEFYMRNTPMPLSIAFVGADGSVVSTTDMAPCADQAGCPLYDAAAPYRTAIEVPQGNLSKLGIEQGATVSDDHRGC